MGPRVLLDVALKSTPYVHRDQSTLNNNTEASGSQIFFFWDKEAVRVRDDCWLMELDHISLLPIL